jgi:hypothetical protein
MIWMFCLLGALLSGCAVTGGLMERDYTFMFHKTGGIMAVDETLTIDSRTGLLTWDPGGAAEAMRTIARPADLEAVTDRLEDADLRHRESAYVCPACADQFIYTGTLTTGTGSWTVRWEDGSDAPRPLFELAAQMQRLINTYFRQGPGSSSALSG